MQYFCLVCGCLHCLRGLLQVPATSPPIYSNQWKAPDSTAPVPAVPSETHSEPDSSGTDFGLTFLCFLGGASVSSPT